MSTPTEYDFDLHFQKQLLLYKDICNRNRVSKADIFTSHRWLEVFRKVPCIKKHARNCLMLLMYTQMHDLDRLCKPFTDVNNLQRDLRQLLLDYDGTKDESESNASKLGGASTHGCGSKMSDKKNFGTDLKTNASMVGNDDANKDLETNASVNGIVEQHSTAAAHFTKTINYLDEFERTAVARMGLAKKGNHKWEKTALESKKTHNMTTALATYQYITKALEQLKMWPNVNWNVGFFKICFKYFMFDNVDLCTPLQELDLKFKLYLENIIEHECEDLEYNVYTLCREQFNDQCKKRNSEALQLKSNQLALAQKRERLESFAESLEKREQLLWQHEKQYRKKIETENNCFNGNSKQKIETENNCFNGNSKQQQQDLLVKQPDNLGTFCRCQHGTRAKRKIKRQRQQQTKISKQNSVFFKKNATPAQP